MTDVQIVQLVAVKDLKERLPKACRVPGHVSSKGHGLLFEDFSQFPLNKMEERKERKKNASTIIIYNNNTIYEVLARP